MARGVSAEERREAVTVLTAGEGVPLDDIEQAYEDWRDSFADAESPGKIKAFQVPLDERGALMLNAKGQIRLGAWPIDLYDFDGLCSMLIRDFMLPTGERIMGVRFIGTQAGKQGLVFNKVVVLRAPQTNSQQSTPNKESLTEVLAALQRMQAENLQLMQRLTQPESRADPMLELQKMMTVAQTLNAPMMQMLTALVPALVGRPAPAVAQPDALGQLSTLVDVVGKVKDLTGDSGGGGAGDSDLVATIKAITPLAGPVLQMGAAAMRAGAAPGTARRVIEGQAVPVQPVPGANPQAVPAQPQAVPAQPAPTPSVQLSDIPSGDHAVFAQLKPQIDALVKMASDGADAAAAADLLYDQMMAPLEDDDYNRVADIIEGPNFVRNASVFNPQVLQYGVWFEAFRKQLIERIKKADAEVGQQPSSAA